MADLKAFVRDLMRDMEADLRTKLDWVAVDHFNTGHPHTHIVIAGHDDRGQDLVMALSLSMPSGETAQLSEWDPIQKGPHDSTP